MFLIQTDHIHAHTKQLVQLSWSPGWWNAIPYTNNIPTCSKNAEKEPATGSKGTEPNVYYYSKTSSYLFRYKNNMHLRSRKGWSWSFPYI